MPVLGICLGAGALHAFIATTQFTLAWTHSIEKIRWEEDYRVVGGNLDLTEARVRGSGAGMEPPAGAVLRDGAWHYRPALPPQAALHLARSTYVQDYEVCVDGVCGPLANWIPVSAGTTTVMACDVP
jgi:hypothetical protein